MPGFPLAAIGAGLGQFAQQYQQQQAARERQQMLAITLAKFQQEQRDRQNQMSAADAAAGLALGAGGSSGVSPVGSAPPASGGFPGSGTMPQAVPAPQPMGGGMRAGGGLSLENMTQLATQAGFSPDKAPIMAAIAMGESRGNPNAFNPSDPHGGSFGLTQINGVHPGAQAARGDPGRAMQMAYDISKGGADFSPWSVYKSGAYRSYLPTGGMGQGGVAPSVGSAPSDAPREQQMAQTGGQTAPVQLPNGLTVPPPDAMDFGQIVRAIKQQHPEFDNRTLLQAAEIAQKDHLGPAYKQSFERWKATTQFGLDDARLRETGRHNVVEEGMGQQRIGLTGQAQAETGRHNVATEGTAAAAQQETGRHNVATEKGAAARLQTQVGKTQQAQQLATTQMKTLADKARQLYQAVEEKPDLVGVRGYGQRMLGGIGEQLGVTKEDPAVADFKAQVGLLQAQLQKPLLGARYFSARAQEQMSALVPALQRLDNPTAVKAALRNLAETLEGTAQAAEAAGRGVGADYSHMSDQELLQSIGIQPGQQ